MNFKKPLTILVALALSLTLAFGVVAAADEIVDEETVEFDEDTEELRVTVINGTAAETTPELEVYGVDNESTETHLATETFSTEDDDLVYTKSDLDPETYEQIKFEVMVDSSDELTVEYDRLQYETAGGGLLDSDDDMMMYGLAAVAIIALAAVGYREMNNGGDW